MRIIRYFLIIIIFIIVASLLGFVVKGQVGRPIYYQTERDTRVGGPFESTNSNSRYALTEAIVEDHTLFFNDARTRFATPDIVEYNGKFFTIFTPGVSFFGIPFYILGKTFGLPQLFSYLSTLLLALVNLVLVFKIARKLGASFYASLISGFIFIFATDALSYALTYTQHHLSVTLLLLAILNIFEKRTFLKNILLGIFFGASLLVDIPNAFMMFPVIFYGFLKNFDVEEINNKVRLSLKLGFIGLIAGLIPMLALFGWYNYQLTGSFTKIGQNVGRTDYLGDGKIKIKPVSDSPKKLPFNTRSQLNGLYILLISNERSWLYYSPIVLLGIFGLVIAYENKQQRSFSIVLISVVLITILIYSMFGDPWGGWSFGPRYLIPAAAVLCSSIALALQKFKKNILFVTLFFSLVFYSVYVSVIGAVTTNAIPPKVEALNLAEPIPYTYKYNLGFIEKNYTGSLFYNLYLSDKMTVKTFVYSYIEVVLGLITVTYIVMVLEKNKKI